MTIISTIHDKVQAREFSVGQCSLFQLFAKDTKILYALLGVEVLESVMLSNLLARASTITFSFVVDFERVCPVLRRIQSDILYSNQAWWGRFVTEYMISKGLGKLGNIFIFWKG